MPKNFFSVLSAFLLALTPAAASAVPYKTGVLLPLTGPGANMGADMRDGILLCGDGQPENWLFEDHQVKPAAGLSAFNKLVEVDQIRLAIVTYSGVASAIIPVARTRRLPLFLTLVSATAVSSQAGEGSVNYFSTGEQEGAVMGNLLTGHLGLKKVAIIYLTGDFGEAYNKSLTSAVAANGGEVIAETFTLGDSDFKPQLLRLIKQNPAALYIVAFDTQVPAITRQARELRYKGRLATIWNIAAPSFRATTGDLYEGMLCTTPRFYASGDHTSTHFKTRFQERFKRDPSAYAAIGCDIAKMLEAHGGQPSLAMQQISSLQQFEGIMGNITKGADGVLHFPLFPAQIRAGEVVLLEAGVTP